MVGGLWPSYTIPKSESMPPLPGGFGFKEGLHRCARLNCSSLLIPVQEVFHYGAKAPLAPVDISPEGYPVVNYPPDLLRYLLGMRMFRWCFLDHHLPEGGE